MFSRAQVYDAIDARQGSGVERTAAGIPSDLSLGGAASDQGRDSMAAGGQERRRCAANQAMAPGYRNMHRKPPVWVTGFRLVGAILPEIGSHVEVRVQRGRGKNSWQGRSF